MGSVGLLIKMLQGPHTQEDEYVIAALLELITDCEPALQEALKSEFELQKLLQTRVSLLKGQDEFEVGYCISLAY